MVANPHPIAAVATQHETEEALVVMRASHSEFSYLLVNPAF